MSIDSSARTAAFILSIALIMTNHHPAISQDLPPELQNQTPVETTGTEAPEQQAAAATEEPTINPGPLEEQRKKLYATIMTAKGYGFGIAAYLNAFNALEESVKTGASEKDVKTRLDSIVSGLEEQLKRSQQLKVQKPAPPIAASSPPPSAVSQNIRNAIQSGNTEGLVDKIKNQWFGGEIPDSIKKKIPANFDPSMLNNENAKELLKKYGGGH